MESTPVRELETAEELANRLKVTVPAVRAWARQGMPHHKLGRCTRFEYHEVLRWFAERRASR